MRPPPPTISRPTTPPTTTAPPPSSAAAALPSSPWHSPVPYLFGGLAAMLALITLALLILACSYWKLNNYLGTGDTAGAAASASAPGATDGNDDGSKSPAATAAASPATVAGLVAVVMAGEETPTFLAAPVVRRARGDEQHADAADAEGSSPGMEKDQEKNHRSVAGGGESGAVAGSEREYRQLDHV